MVYWVVSDTCCGEICEDVFRTSNFDLACYWLRSHSHLKKYECLVMYREVVDDYIKKKLN